MKPRILRFFLAAALALTLGVTSSRAQAVRGLSEAQLVGNARTFTARQTFTIIALPLCATDPPTGACTSRDFCIDDTNDRLYVCTGSSWHLTAQATAACSTDPPTGACTENQLCLDDTNRILYGCEASTWVKVSARVQDDPTPQLAGDLDVNGRVLKHGAYNEIALMLTPYTLGQAASLTVKNGDPATGPGAGPQLAPEAIQPNVDLRITAKGTGVVRFEKPINADNGINCVGECIDAGDETNLSVTAPATLTGDTVGVADATAGAKGAVQLAGDLAGTAAAPAIAADAVALGTDTTGSYAAGDAEAGNATGLACAGACVDVSSETNLAVTAPATLTGDTVGVADATAGAKGAVQLAGDLAGTAAAPVVAADSVALPGDTTGNYVGSVATTSPLGGGAGGSEGATLTLTVDDATAGGKGVMQLAGDLAGTAASPTVAANAVALATDTTGSYLATIADSGNGTMSVIGSGPEGAAVSLQAIDLACSNCIGAVEIADLTLGTDTAGSYAAGDGEAGNATGLACTDCTALTTETSGNYAAGDAEAGNATGLACAGACVDVSSETNLAVTAPATLTGDTVGVADATAGAKGAIQLAGDLAGTAAAPAIAADSVALGTDTTGSYAAGDAEAGNATGLACAGACVDVSSETNLAVASPVTLTGDTVGFDATAGVCAPLSIKFNPDESLDYFHDLYLRDTATADGEAKNCLVGGNCDGFIMPRAGTVSDIGAITGTAVASGSWAVHIMEDGISQITCTISSGTTCTSAASASVAAGSLITVKTVPTSPTAAAKMNVSFCIR